MSTSKTTGIPTYRLLGSSGLRVFPLSLGAMSFGDSSEFYSKLGSSSPFDEAEKVFLKYVSVGGNFIDTANFYQGGQSEEWIGKIIKKNNIDREQLVIATKYSLPMVSGDPNASGNHKKNIIRSVKESLARLQTDYIDILYVHFWDWSVDIKDLMRDLDEIVRTGKVLHIAASDFPAWVVSAANVYAEERGFNKFVAYQGRYNLTQRDLEQEIIPMAKHLKIGTVPWGALAGGKLSGTRTRENPNGTGKRQLVLTDTEFKIQDEVIAIANEIKRTPSQVAVNWILQKATSPLLGCRTLEQLEDNLGALEFELTPQQIARLDEVSKDSPAILFPNNFLGKDVKTTPFFHLPNPADKKYDFDSKLY